MSLRDLFVQYYNLGGTRNQLISTPHGLHKRTVGEKICTQILSLKCAPKRHAAMNVFLL